MAVILCQRGHYYEEDKFFQCPYCGVDIRMQINNNSNNFIKESKNKGCEKTLLLPKKNAGKTLLLSGSDGDKTSLITNTDSDKTLLITNADSDKTLLISDKDDGKTLHIQNADVDKTLLISDKDDGKTLHMLNVDDDRSSVKENADCPDKSVITEGHKGETMLLTEKRWLKFFKRRKNDKT